MLTSPRPLLPSEHDAALHLWQAVFRTSPGYFERYYAADPEYQPGDTLGIWDGGTLVSAVHLCRRPAVWGSGFLLCGGIANVATREEYRRRGLSRQLLARTITKMEQEGFNFSLLATGTHSHYAALGWELTHRPQVTLNPAPSGASAAVSWDKLNQAAPLGDAYGRVPRPLQFLRAPTYWEHWVGWDWRGQNAWVGTTAAGDYLALAAPEEEDQPLSVLEWRAGNAAGELALLQAAASRALERSKPRLLLETLPQHLSGEALASLGKVTRNAEDEGMIRNITLPPEEYAQVIRAYAGSLAAWWPGDYF